MNNVVGDELVDYTLETILLFLQLKSSSHPVYVKKLKQQFPGRTIVPMDHRIKLIEYIEDPEELRLEVYIPKSFSISTFPLTLCLSFSESLFT